jgi:hypothetical protein
MERSVARSDKSAQYLMRILPYRGRNNVIEGYGEHGAGHAHRVMPGGDKIAGAIEHDNNLTVGRHSHGRDCRSPA